MQYYNITSSSQVGLLQVELVDVATGRRAVDVDRREADNHVDLYYTILHYTILLLRRLGLAALI